jgi:hypothetical protein
MDIAVAPACAKIRLTAAAILIVQPWVFQTGEIGLGIVSPKILSARGKNRQERTRRWIVSAENCLALADPGTS